MLKSLRKFMYGRGDNKVNKKELKILNKLKFAKNHLDYLITEIIANDCIPKTLIGSKDESLDEALCIYLGE